MFYIRVPYLLTLPPPLSYKYRRTLLSFEVVEFRVLGLSVLGFCVAAFRAVSGFRIFRIFFGVLARFRSLKWYTSGRKAPV